MLLALIILSWLAVAGLWLMFQVSIILGASIVALLATCAVLHAWGARSDMRRW